MPVLVDPSFIGSTTCCCAIWCVSAMLFNMSCELLCPLLFLVFAELISPFEVQNHVKCLSKSTFVMLCTISFFLNWDSLYTRLNSHYEAWSYDLHNLKNLKTPMEERYLKHATLLKVTLLHGCLSRLNCTNSKNHAKCLIRQPRFLHLFAVKGACPSKDFFLFHHVHVSMAAWRITSGFIYRFLFCSSF